jgi:hypothetical protein
LRDLIEAGVAQDAAEARDARVAGDRLLPARRIALRVIHRAEFVDTKQAVAVAIAILPKEHRPRRAYLDGDRNADEKRQQEQYAGQRA